MPADLLAFFKWYLAITFLGVAAWPLAFKLLGRLPDRGYTLLRTLGLLFVSYVFWLAGSVGLVRNDTPGFILAAAVVGGAGLAWLRRSGLAELAAWVKTHWRVVVAVEVVFVAAFGLMTVVRAYNPQLDGTERPMEFMFINSILKGATFPPQDTWLSGNPISYYYFGYVMVAALTRLTGLVPEVAFNFSLAMLFALAAVGALGVVMNLMALVKHQMQKAGAARPASAFMPSVFGPALVAPLLVLVVGNFYGAASLLNENGIFANLKIPVVRYYFGTNDPANTGPSAVDPSQVPLTTRNQPGLYAGWTNLWDWLDLKAADEPTQATPAGKPFNWDLGNWFFAARVVKDRNLTYSDSNTEAIDEMPAFSFILGDMHPHVLGLPFVMLCVALALEWLLWATTFVPAELYQVEKPAKAAARRRERASFEAYAGRLWARLKLYAAWSQPVAGRLLLSAVVLGAIFFLNTWDFPIYVFLVGLALAVGLHLSWGRPALARHWLFPALLALALAVLGVLFYWPYVLTAQSQVQGLLPNLIYPTRFQQTFIMFGPVLIGVTAFVIWLTRRYRGSFNRAAAWWAGGGITVGVVLAALALVLALAILAFFRPSMMDFVQQLVAPLPMSQAVGLLVQRRLVDSWATLFPAVIIGLTFGLGWGGLAAETGAVKKPKEEPRPPAEGRAADLRNPAVLMVLLMMLTGALLLLGPEWVYVHDLFGDRMNTMFKFYFQAWILWSLAVAFGWWYMLQFAGRTARWVMSGLMSLAMVAGLLYTFPGLSSKASHFAGPPTLDGMAWFAKAAPDDWAAIQWLRQNVSGTPVIAEGSNGEYFMNGYYSRISMSTGLPTILGWLGHEDQWRGNAYFTYIRERARYLCGLYQLSDWAPTKAILDHFGVEYVYVSPLETSRYKPVSVRKFDQNMRRVFQSGDVSIYQREPGSPAATPAALPDVATLCPNFTP